MKRKDLMKRLASEAKRQGLDMIITEGGNHTKVSIGERATVVARHNEVNEITAKAILKQMGIKP